MTAVAGFPIASVLPGGPKAHGQSGAPTASSPQAPSATAILSFRTGFERLIHSQQESSARETASSEAMEEELKEASASEPSVSEALASDAGSGAMPAHFRPIGSSSATASGKTQNPVSTSLSGTRIAGARIANSKTARLSGETPGQTAASPTETKTSGSERATQSRQSRIAGSSAKTTTQADASPDRMPAQIAVPTPVLNPIIATQPAQAAQLRETGHAAVLSNSASSTAAPAFALPAASTRQATAATQLRSAVAPAGAEEKAVSTAAAATEEAHSLVNDAISNTGAVISNTGIPAAEAHRAHAIAANAQTAQSSHSNESASLPAPADNATLASSLKFSSAQPASVTTDDLSHLSAASLENSAASASSTRSSSASRVRGPLEHESATTIAQQQVQLSGQMISHATPVRDASGIPGSSADRSSSGSSAASHFDSGASQTARDPFPLLDADPGQPATQWTHASARQVEAGYQDPALGWVSVRADATPGGLHASVVPSSPEAAQALGTHLFGLNAFLSEQHGGSITASLASPDGNSSAAGQNGQAEREQQNPSGEPPTAQTASSTSSSSSSSTGNAQASQLSVPALAHNGHISVIA